MSEESLKSLLLRFFQDDLSETEKETLANWINEQEDDQQLDNLLESAWNDFKPDELIPGDRAKRMLEGILKNIDADEKKIVPINRMQFWNRFAAAASVLLVLLAGYFYLANPGEDEVSPVSHTQSTIENIEPGGNKAILTLSDGSQIILDSAFNGALTQQGGVTIIKLDDGELSYQKDKADEKTMVYNTITTPRGGQYQLTLSDGTKVWLNAESSLRYPAAFKGNERKVELSGEGYFEVARNEKMPFYVSADNIEVKVLGTHFNVNAYADDGKLKTTLFEGLVEVNAGGSKVRLNPGEQAMYQLLNNDLQSFGNIDMDQVIAWKEGYFSFQNASLKEVLLQIGRWYDVDFKFEGDIAPRKFGGGISRNSDLNDLLKILEKSRVHFRIENRTIIVKP